MENTKLNATLKEIISSTEYQKRGDETILVGKGDVRGEIREILHKALFNSGLTLDHAYRVLEAVICSIENQLPDDPSQPFDEDRASEIDAPVYTGELLEFVTVGNLDEIEEAMRENDTDSIATAIMWWYQEKARDMFYTILEGAKSLVAKQS